MTIDKLFFNNTLKHPLNSYFDENEDYMDATEYHIYHYVNQIETFILNYGYNNQICSISKNDSILDIENHIRNFLVNNADAWNHLEILGTLDNLENNLVYACCYEPYGDELLYIENKNNKLFFFNIFDKKKIKINFF